MRGSTRAHPLRLDQETELQSRHANQVVTDRGTQFHSTHQADRILRIRQRVADGAYNDPSVIAHVARRLMDGGEMT